MDATWKVPTTTTSTQLSWRSHDKYVNVVDTIYVADAVADTDEIYGAYAAAENNTFNNANGSPNNANNRNTTANYSTNYMYGQYLFLAEDVSKSRPNTNKPQPQKNGHPKRSNTIKR